MKKVFMLMMFLSFSLLAQEKSPSVDVEFEKYVIKSLDRQLQEWVNAQEAGSYYYTKMSYLSIKTSINICYSYFDDTPIKCALENINDIAETFGDYKVRSEAKKIHRQLEDYYEEYIYLGKKEKLILKFPN